MHQKTTNKYGLSDFSREYPKLLCRNILKPLLDVMRIHKVHKYVDLLSDVLSACVKDTKQNKKSFSEVSRREHRICEAASQIDLWNQGAICNNVLCARESMAESIDHAHAKPSPKV